MKKAVKKTEANEQKPQITHLTRKADTSVPKTPAATDTRIYGVPQTPQATRPPVRKYFNTTGKYIRSSKDTSVEKTEAVDPIRGISEGISIASLKEKFGLSQQQIEGVIKDAEKHGRVRKYVDGSYAWV